MGWEDWPYWVKGGLLAVTIYIIVTIILIPFGQVKSGYFKDVPYWIMYPNFVGYLLSLSLTPSPKPGPFLDFMISLNNLLIFIYSAIFYFLIGALIGWIVGKFKSKNVQ